MIEVHDSQPASSGWRYPIQVARVKTMQHRPGAMTTAGQPCESPGKTPPKSPRYGAGQGWQGCCCCCWTRARVWGFRCSSVNRRDETRRDGQKGPQSPCRSGGAELASSKSKRRTLPRISKRSTGSSGCRQFRVG